MPASERVRRLTKASVVFWCGMQMLTPSLAYSSAMRSISPRLAASPAVGKDGIEMRMHLRPVRCSASATPSISFGSGRIP